MVFLLNLLFAVATFAVLDYAILPRLGIADPVKVIISVIAGVVIFFANLAASVIN